MPRGGKRPGAGRRANGRKQLQIWATEDERDVAIECIKRMREAFLSKEVKGDEEFEEDGGEGPEPITADSRGGKRRHARVVRQDDP